MSYGEMPPYVEFVRAFQASGTGPTFRIEAHTNSEDGQALRHAGARPVGKGDYGKDRYELSPKKLYAVTKRLANGDEESMSLASGIMQSLGYEWI